MDTSPAVIVALAALCASPEPFSQQGVNALFRACIVRFGVEWDSPQSMERIERLWESDTVVSAIEALRDVHEAGRDTASARQRLLATIKAEILRPG